MREHRVANRLGNLVPSRHEHLRDVERIARSDTVELVGIDTVGLGELCDGFWRERQQVQALDGWPGHLAEHDSERMRRTDGFPAVADDEQDGHGLDTASDQPEYVECRLVGPMHVLEHENRRPVPRDVPHERSGDLVRNRIALQELAQLGAGLVCDVDDGSERSRREQRIARTFEDPGEAVDARAERTHEGGLSDAGLTRDEHEPSGSCSRLRECALQRGERFLSLEQGDDGIAHVGGRGHLGILVHRPVLRKNATLRCGRRWQPSR